MSSNYISSVFIRKDEQLVAVLGNSVAQSYFSSGIIGKGFAILSDRRVYFKGNCFVRDGKRFYTQREERIVDLRDVTGTGFSHSNPVWMKVLSIISFVLGCFFSLYLLSGTLVPVLGSILFLGASVYLYFLHKAKKRTLFEIAFAGGCIAFNVAWHPAQEAQLFHTALRQEMDKLRE